MCVCTCMCVRVCDYVFYVHVQQVKKGPYGTRIQHEPRSDCASMNSDLCVRVCVVVV